LSGTDISSKRCLFSAPHDFLPEEVVTGFQDLVPTEFREVSRREDLEADAGLTFWVVDPGQNFLVDDEVLGLFPSLEAVITPSTGTNHLHLDACQERGIAVYSLLDDRAGLNTISASAEFTFLLLLNTLRRLDVAMAESSAGRWREREEVMRGRELSGKRVGLVGMGRIGRRMATYCSAFDAEVVYYDPYVDKSPWKKMSLEALFKSSDAVCVCCALTRETDGLIGFPLLSHLKEGASLVNTSRGEVIVETDLVTLLGERPDISVALDVLPGESQNLHRSSELIEFHKRGQIVVTPHVAGATQESQSKAARCALSLLERHMSEDSSGSSLEIGERS